MYKVIIAEDEQIIRKGLVFSIPWSELDCTVVADCADGREGIESILKYKPDIVITDINMPVTDGLEMIKETYEKVDYAAIILSGYSDFEYAQTAIRYGVLDYILKPLSKPELIEAVGKAKVICDKRHIVRESLTEEENAGLIAELKVDSYRGDDIVVMKMLKFIDEHYKQKIVINDLVRELNYSDTFLNKKFKEAMGTTFMEYVNRYRVRRAISMVQEEKVSLQDVSWECGIGEYKYFSIVFKKYLGCSPKEFFRQ